MKKTKLSETAKKNIQERLTNSMNNEKITPGNVAKLLNIHISYISIIRNTNQWKKCSEKAWTTVLLWINSGLSMKAYSERRIVIIKETKPDKEEKIEEKMKEKVKEKVEEKVKEYTEFTKSNTSTLLGLLKTERLSLEKQINAIDTLLKCYLIKFKE